MTFAQQIIPLAFDMEKTAKAYEALGVAPSKPSAHDTMNRASLQATFRQQLADVLALFNARTPKHWDALSLEPVYSHSGQVSIRPYKPYDPDYYSDYHGTAYNAKAFIRLMGIFDGALSMAETPMNPLCQARWEALALPPRFAKPTPLLFHGNNEAIEIPGYHLHDVVSQSIVGFHHWSLPTMMTGSRRSDPKQSFEDGQVYTAKNFFKYLVTSWMADRHFLMAIRKTKLLVKGQIDQLTDILGHQHADQILYALLTLLEKTDKSQPLADHAVFVNANTRRPVSYLYKAHDAAHALAQSMCPHASLLTRGDVFTKDHPSKWPVYKVEALSNPCDKDVGVI